MTSATASRRTIGGSARGCPAIPRGVRRVAAEVSGLDEAPPCGEGLGEQFAAEVGEACTVVVGDAEDGDGLDAGGVDDADDVAAVGDVHDEGEQVVVDLGCLFAVESVGDGDDVVVGVGGQGCGDGESGDAGAQEGTDAGHGDVLS